MGMINDLLMIMMETVNRRAPRRVRARRNLTRAQGHSEPAAHPSSFIDSAHSAARMLTAKTKDPASCGLFHVAPVF
jgi:hypothetical protein